MSEILDWYGVWDFELVELMLSVALEIDANRAATTHGAVASAVARLFDKRGGEAFDAGLKKIQQQVRRNQLEARGAAPKEESTATKMRDIFRKLNIPQTKGKKANGGRSGGRRV